MKAGRGGVPISVSFLLVLSFLASRVQGQSGCPLRLTVAPQSPPVEALWNADALYWVSSSSPTAGAYDVLVVGDTLRLTPSSFPMLARSDDRPITNWRRIVFDARRIVVAMPLIFSSAAVELRAEEIAWEPEGRVVLRGGTPAGGHDGLTITASRVDLSRAPVVPFDFETDNWTAYPNDDADVAPQNRWARTLAINAGRLVPPAKLDTPPADSWVWLRTLTRDRWILLHGGRDGTFSRRPYVLKLGAEGEGRYQEDLRQSMLWPSALAAKAERVFSQNPYDPAGKEFFLSRLGIEAYVGNLLGSPRHRVATETLVHVASSLRRGVDLFGYPAEFVPRVTFSVLEESFTRQFAKTEQLALRALEQVLGDQSAAASAGERENQLSALHTQHSALAVELKKLQDATAPIVASIETLRQDYQAEDANLEAFKRKVDDWAAAKRESLEQRKNLQTAIDGIGLVGTVAVTAYAGPQAGAVFAKGWGTIGGAVERHQEGHDITNLQEAAEAIAAGEKQGQDWAAFAQDAVKQWADLKASGAQGKTVVEQVTQAFKLANTVDKQVRAIGERARLSTAADANFDLDAGWKAEADAHRAAMAAINTAIAERQMQLSAKASEIAQKLVEMQHLDVLEDALNAASPANDSQRAESEAFYSSLFNSLLVNLTTEYATLGRAYSYYVRADAPPPDLTPLRNSLATLQNRQLERLASEGREAPAATVALGDLLQRTFDVYKKALLTMDHDIGTAYASAMNGSKFDEQWEYSAASSDRVNADAVRRISRKIAELFATIKAGAGTRKQAEALVPIRVDPFLSDSPSAPELLEEIYVSALQLSGAKPSDARLELTMVHPGYGDLVRGPSCYLVSFADAAARENVLLFPAVVARDGSISYAGKAQDVYAPFPLRTNYALRISVLRTRADRDFSAWTAPRVDGFTIRARYIRY
jgi:hypothetical protein